MVLIKALETDCICVTQAEDPACMTPATLKHIKDNSKIQVVASDNDPQGKKFSWWLTTEHGYKHCNVPDPLREKGLTDFADWARAEKSLSVVRNHFIKKGFI